MTYIHRRFLAKQDVSRTRKRWHILLTWLNGRWYESKADSETISKTQGVFSLKTERVIFRSHFIVLNRDVADVKITKIPLCLISGYKWVWSCSCCHRELVTGGLEVEHPVPIVTKKSGMNYHHSFIPASQEETVGRLLCTGISGLYKGAHVTPPTHCS